jgi:hypothetical protein
MRDPASEKLEIIRLVEQSHLPVRRTLAALPSRGRGLSRLTRSPLLDHLGGRHPALCRSAWDRAADRFMSDIGGLLPMALWGRTSL